MDFNTYLQSKKIDSAAFKAAEPARWATWEKEFSDMHPGSFTAQKLYLINPLRRLYLLKETSDDNATTEKTKPQVAATAAPAFGNKANAARTSTVVSESSQQTEAKAEEQAPIKAKPVMPKPVVKTPAAPAKDESNDASTDAPKAKPAMPKPVMKPVIKPPIRTTEETSTSESESAESNNAAGIMNEEEAKPKPRPVMPRPVIKPKPKSE